MSALVLALLAAAPAPAASPAAVVQSRICEEAAGEESLEACRRALALGLGPARAASVRRLLAQRLASLERWDELIEWHREAARLAPEDASVQFRLGSALLAVGRAQEALDPLRESAQRSADARTLALLGMAESALGRYSEALAVFEEALRLDPAVLDERPAARAALEAARNRSPWP